jgi:hypothetical protein
LVERLLDLLPAERGAVLAEARAVTPEDADAAEVIVADVERLTAELYELPPPAQRLRLEQERANLPAAVPFVEGLLGLARPEGRAPDEARTAPFVERLAGLTRIDPEWARLAARAGTLAGLPPLRPADGGGNDFPCRFGDYEVTEYRGRGAQGVVYRAHHPFRDEDVALKVFPEARGAPAEVLRTVAREVALAARLRHENIVEVHGCGTTPDGWLYCSMRYVDGRGLDALPPGADWPPPGPARAVPAARLVAAVGRAVQHAHDRGVRHRDLKPANILVTAGGVPHVTDFGAGFRADEAPAGAWFQGTPCYACPEQHRCDALTPAVDVWALGVILYELLTGRRPFDEEGLGATAAFGPKDGDGLAALRRRICDEPPRPLPAWIDDGLARICLRCLEKAPEARGPAALLADDLEAWAAGEETSVRPWPWWRRSWRACRRRPAVASLTVLLAVAAVVIPWLVSANHLVAVEKDRDSAEKARQIAEVEAQRAADNMRLALTHERNETVSSAQAALDRGDVRGAFDGFERALGAAVTTAEEALSFRVARLPCLLVLQGGDAFERELSWLEAQTLTADDRARVLLWRGDLLLSDEAGLEKGRALVRQAVATGKLQGADAQYAHALQAPTVAEAVRRLRALLAEHPFHVRGNHCLALLLAGGGEVEEARRRLAVARAAFPADPTLALIAAFLEVHQHAGGRWVAVGLAVGPAATPLGAAEGGLPAAFVHLAAAREQLGDDRWGRLRAALSVYDDLLASLDLDRGTASGGPNLIAQVSGRLRLRAGLDGPGGPIALRVPATAWMVEVEKEVRAARLAAIWGGEEEGIRRLVKVVDGYRTAELLFLLGDWESALQREAEGRGRSADAARHAGAAADWFRQAAAAPTTVPRYPWRYESLLRALAREADLERLTGPDAERSARLRHGLIDAVTEGRRYPAARRALLPLLARQLPPDTGLDLLGLWEREEPLPTAGRRARVALLVRAGRVAEAAALRRWYHPRDEELEEALRRAREAAGRQ